METFKLRYDVVPLPNTNDRVNPNDITNSQTLQSIEGTTEELVERYNTGLQELLDKHAPLQTKVITIRPNTPWYNDSLRAAKRNRRKAERKMRKSNLTVHTEIYKEACIIYNKLMLQTKKDYYSSKIEENSNDRRHLFKLTNTLMGCKRDTVLPSTDNDKSLANKFCDFFIGKNISIRNKLSENQTDNDVLRADVNLPVEIKHIDSLTVIKKALKTHLFKLAYQ
ncbi:hypothetical protein MAR_016094 [Mya arenaria]|uniref:Uncharacterized protein n=1 Tax=Mya arenaria TaxID=6604 RepID=A0ABY7FIV8_MYAAR|nr:hypothetical protein MAR_016094 [Mya arenaria]